MDKTLDDLDDDTSVLNIDSAEKDCTSEQLMEESIDNEWGNNTPHVEDSRAGEEGHVGLN